MVKVLVGGCFDILHVGHIRFLRAAKSLGDELVVVVAHDDTVSRKKGRIIMSCRERAEIINSIRYVDKAVCGDPRDFFKVVEREEPDIIAIGYDQNDEWIREIGASRHLKFKLVRVEKFGEYSTKDIVAKIISHHR